VSTTVTVVLVDVVDVAAGVEVVDARPVVVDETRAATGAVPDDATTACSAARPAAVTPTIITRYTSALAAPAIRRWARAGWGRRGREENRSGPTPRLRRVSPLG
jgi:hypothetical protein